MHDRATALKSKLLSNTQSHALRTALFANQGDEQYQLMQKRFPNIAKKFDEDSGSLFYETSDGTFATSFLDALDAMEFLENKQCEPSNQEDGETT